MFSYAQLSFLFCLLRGEKDKKERESFKKAVGWVLTKRERRKAGEDMETVSCKRKMKSELRLKSALKVSGGSKIMPRKTKHTVYSAQRLVEMSFRRTTLRRHLYISWYVCGHFKRLLFTSSLHCSSTACPHEMFFRGHASMFSSLTTYNIRYRHSCQPFFKA